MKNKGWICFVLVFFGMLISFGSLAAGMENVVSISLDLQNDLPIQTEQVGIFKLPDSLVIIDEEAFSGTMIQNITIPESVEEIGIRAFAENKLLKLVFISSKEVQIADDAFYGGKPLLSGFSDSYARNWAKKNGYYFLFQPAWKTKNRIESAAAKIENNQTESNQQHTYKDLAEIIKKEQRTGRTVGEVKAARYKGIAAVHIQSRFFP